MADWIVVLLCCFYIGVEVFVAFILYKFFHLKSEYTRKLIHILTSFVIVPVEYYVSSPFWRLICPFVFIFVNIFACLSGLVKDLGMTDGKRHIGLILYPISVTGVVALEALGIIRSEAAICSVLIMGLGDGSAALVGTAFGRHSYNVYHKYKKSLEGSFFMAAISAIIVLFFTTLNVYQAILVGITVSLVENFSPSSVDNVSVPFYASLNVEVLCRV